MTKNVKMLLGVALVGGVGYYFWKKSQTPATASFSSNYANASAAIGCPCKKVVGSVSTTDGKTLNKCAGGQYCEGQGKAQM
jgi:hypothetical protein